MSRTVKKKEIFQSAAMLCWLLFLADADAYYVPYLVVGILGFLCLFENHTKKRAFVKKNQRLVRISAALFSFLIVAANYEVWAGGGMDDLEFAGPFFRMSYQVGMLFLLSAGGYAVMNNILSFAVVRLEKAYIPEEKMQTMRPTIVFFVSFASIAVWYLFILVSCRYPGLLTIDSINQIGQIKAGVYSNHHPFYHTMVIRFFVFIGFKIFGNINAAVAVYHVFQILFMAMCFSMVCLTLYEMKINGRVLLTIAAWYLLMPFHIVYSFTMWKDVMFGGFVSLFIVFIYRILRRIGKYSVWNYVLLFISGVGVCVFRSNGFFAFLLMFLVFLVLFGKKEKRICFVLITTIAVSFFMKHDVLDILGVSQPSMEEALSIPLQQIARVAAEHHDFSDKQKEILNQVIEVDALAEAYTAWISDPVKGLMRETGNQQYLADHKLEFLKIYIEIGFRHPISYIKAWIDGTKGFWNAGYPYWRWADEIAENSFGIKQTIYSAFLDRHLKDYLWIFTNNRFLQLFLCIGFYIWIDMFLCLMSVIRKDKAGLFICIPILTLLATLMISTPVYAEFRYMYAVFCSLPFLMAAVFSKKIKR